MKYALAGRIWHFHQVPKSKAHRDAQINWFQQADSLILSSCWKSC